ncbi:MULTISPECIES: ribosomal L7Ae/L30e/S12e/Gadd45 family protein [Clostridium]|uniref:Ribosomal L7Ae/L30e/S12e/Gadd45 family protein n=1 Tax=Clostridium aquiflavi TaxID=3073603 RepID=A0ABU1EES6_9CLOT|nr:MULTISPECIES: ribosomal L7Ae/L30e/S12e/Gadd45 family protein [unclassified Clostridium]MDR5586887.1 ribosomal L7Ae/L30e/S12e/Gadd45 family protein [Clostridium sp. 5N-1]NFG61570.1 50S ribosomal protein L7ae-like protein [Clostridium botulinum]NFQ10635.1 50S ribosomal protein L7ae-like protein [Clostridium botulinum]
MNKFYNFLGIAKKSGNLLEGYSKCDDLRNKLDIYLFIISNDLSQSSKEKFIKHCVQRNIPYINSFSKEELGSPIGRDQIMILGILDKNMAKKLLEIYEEEKQYMSR